MPHKFILITLVLVACLPHFAFGQSEIIKKDSSKVYRNIETFSKKRKCTKFIYDLFFLPVSPTPVHKTDVYKKKLSRPSGNFDGKIIRHINITTLNPFGYSITDSTEIPQNFIYRAGNDLHIRTRQITIRNLLLFRKNKPFDSLLVKESERLIRAQKYVHEVSFTVRQTAKKSDSVDIDIRVLDIWSVVPGGAISTSGLSISLEEKNFSGLGHDYQNTFSQNFINGKNTIKTNYLVPNIANTYISTALHYESDENDNYNKILSIDRPFYSPFARLAGGVYIAQQFHSELLKAADSTLVPQDFKLNIQDLWAGHANQIFKGNTENARTTNLTEAARFIRSRYVEKPGDNYDTLHIYSNEDFYLTSIGISTRKYIQDKYIFNYGLTEDIPVGMVYSLTQGYKVKNYSGQLYLGARASFGNFIKLGYLSTNFEYGTFFRLASTKQGVFSAGFNYFTELFEMRGIKMRQFIKSNYVIGLNRLPGESLNINNANGIMGFNSLSLVGTQKILLTFQTQFYLPWRIIGFHFGPYLVYSLGALGNQASGFIGSKVYSQFGFGLLIKNEYLVFKIFQISVAFYPVIPGIGNNIFKIDPDKTSDFGFRDFDIGKPSIVGYN